MFIYFPLSCDKTTQNNIYNQLPLREGDTANAYNLPFWLEMMISTNNLIFFFPSSWENNKECLNKKRVDCVESYNFFSFSFSLTPGNRFAHKSKKRREKKLGPTPSFL
eukprot:TRINITY_DN9602_c0_g3_i2.p1 TRINITY_DN9602_c0_g3~~TRINITY_DN9602_c0_g3_i2.p1  ORF type:complete len:108 (+),score=4.20 TRINITY_DN9602_c0_g3_i2:970-1293(+)